MCGRSGERSGPVETLDGALGADVELQASRRPCQRLGLPALVLDDLDVVRPRGGGPAQTERQLVALRRGGVKNHYMTEEKESSLSWLQDTR